MDVIIDCLTSREIVPWQILHQSHYWEASVARGRSRNHLQGKRGRAPQPQPQQRPHHLYQNDKCLCEECYAWYKYFADILYLDAFQKISSTTHPNVLITNRVRGDSISPLGIINLHVMFRSSPWSKTMATKFMVVNILSAYDAIIE